MKPKLASKGKCTACMACIDSCPKNALKSYVDKNGRFQIACEEEACIGCNLCVKTCPVVSFQFGKRPGGTSQPYAAWAIDDEIRLHSASGGIFAALAYSVLSENGVVVGAWMDGLEVKMHLIEDIHDLPKLQGSKYQQANSRGIYQLVRTYLRKNKKVLFSGAPCQICALYSFLKDNKYNELLITTDFICSGFPSLLPLKYELKKYPDVETLTFTDKTDGWLKSKSLHLFSKQGEKISIGWNNGISGAFTSKLTHRGSCVNCRFCHAERVADITLGDFWGDTNFPAEHTKGLSIAIVHSSKGRKALEAASVEMKATTWRSFLMSNPRMIYGKLLSAQFHPLRLYTGWFYRHKTLNAIYPLLHYPWGKNFLSLSAYRIFQLLFYSFPLKRHINAVIRKKG